MIPGILQIVCGEPPVASTFFSTQTVHPTAAQVSGRQSSDLYVLAMESGARLRLTLHVLDVH